MSTRNYVIPDLDDDDQEKLSEAPTFFTKRVKTDHIVVPTADTVEVEPTTTTTKNNGTSQETFVQALPSINPTVTTPSPSPAIPSSSSLLVHSRQRGNPLLKHIRQVKWEYSDQILGGADYSMSRSSCALYLSLRYHTLNPNYIYDRLKTSKFPYQLKILLVQCDIGDPTQSLKELARLCNLYDLTLLLSWNDEEAARYLETYRIMEGKSAENLLDTQQHQSNDYLTKYSDMITQVKSVNKSDSQTLLHAFGSVESVLNATNEQLCVCPDLGRLKAQRLYQAFNQPFLRNKTSNKSSQKPSNSTLKEKQFYRNEDNEQLDLSNIDEDL